MTHDGGDGGRRRVWRWAVGVWVAVVAVGGGVTLWLQDSTEPPAGQPYGRHAPQESAAPLLHMDVDDDDLCDKAKTKAENDGEGDGGGEEAPDDEAANDRRIVVCAWPTNG
ncbi:hypothetical protein [Streptomyces sp. NPDC051677]|uniref:hypothetical protein n=1 Tax=Streptomyces sp. NPDC051677 TaxID=3365669 RepID=UPI0037D12A6C